MAQNKGFKAVHGNWCKCCWMVVIQGADGVYFRQRNDNSGLQARWDSGLGWRLVENPGEDTAGLHRSLVHVPEHHLYQKTSLDSPPPQCALHLMLLQHELVVVVSSGTKKTFSPSASVASPSASERLPGL